MLSSVLLIFAVLEAVDKVITALRHARSGPSKKRKAKDEVNYLFKKKRTKGTSWKHRFDCLATRGQDHIPTTDIETDDLLRAGLGEKNVEFDDIDMDANSYRDVILKAYPQLKNAGGFVF